MSRLLALALVLAALTACAPKPVVMKTDVDHCALLTPADFHEEVWEQLPQADGPDACTFSIRDGWIEARVEVDRDATVEDLSRGDDGDVSSFVLRDWQVRQSCMPPLNPGGGCTTMTQLNERTVLLVSVRANEDSYRDYTTRFTDKVLEQLFVTS